MVKIREKITETTALYADLSTRYIVHCSPTPCAQIYRHCSPTIRTDLPTLFTYYPHRFTYIVHLLSAQIYLHCSPTIRTDLPTLFTYYPHRFTYIVHLLSAQIYLHCSPTIRTDLPTLLTYSLCTDFPTWLTSSLCLLCHYQITYSIIQSTPTSAHDSISWDPPPPSPTHRHGLEGCADIYSCGSKVNDHSISRLDTR